MSGFIYDNGNLGNALNFTYSQHTNVAITNTSTAMQFQAGDSFSVSCCFMLKSLPSSVSDIYVIHSYAPNGGYKIAVFNSNYLYFYFTNLSQSQSHYHISVTLKANTFYNVSFTYSNGNSFFYVNNVLVTSLLGPTPSALTYTTNTSYIGQENGVQWFDGYIYNITYFNRVITLPEINYYYKYEGAIAPSAQGNVLANWTFDEKKGSILHDVSGNNLNGTLVNFSATALSGSNSWVDAYTLLPIQR